MISTTISDGQAERLPFHQMPQWPHWILVKRDLTSQRLPHHAFTLMDDDLFGLSINAKTGWLELLRYRLTNVPGTASILRDSHVQPTFVKNWHLARSDLPARIEEVMKTLPSIMALSVLE